MDPNANAALDEWRAQVAARGGLKPARPAAAPTAKPRPAAAPTAKPVAPAAPAPRLGFFATLAALFSRRP